MQIGFPARYKQVKLLKPTFLTGKKLSFLVLYNTENAHGVPCQCAVLFAKCLGSLFGCFNVSKFNLIFEVNSLVTKYHN